MENQPTACGLPIGYAYVPPQRLTQVLSVEEALCRGTLFPELYLPMGVYDAANCKYQKGGCRK